MTSVIYFEKTHKVHLKQKTNLLCEPDLLTLMYSEKPMESNDLPFHLKNDPIAPLNFSMIKFPLLFSYIFTRFFFFLTQE